MSTREAGGGTAALGRGGLGREQGCEVEDKHGVLVCHPKRLLQATEARDMAMARGAGHLLS